MLLAAIKQEGFVVVAIGICVNDAPIPLYINNKVRRSAQGD